MVQKGDSVDVLQEGVFGPFKAKEFNPAQFASTSLQTTHSTAQAQIQQLKQGIGILENELRREVNDRHEELFGHAKRLMDQTRALSSVQLSVETLQSSLNRVRSEISGPYQQMKNKSKQLENLYSVIDILRATVHHMRLITKLRQQMSSQEGNIIDLAKAAKIIIDLQQVHSEVNLSGIKAVSCDNAYIQEVQTEVRDQAYQALQQGLSSLSQAEVGSALQVYFNLGELKKAVDDTLLERCNSLTSKAYQALDPKTIGGSQGVSSVAFGRIPGVQQQIAGSGQGGQQQQVDKVWERVKELLEDVRNAGMAIWHLQRVIEKKRDPLTHVSFGEVLEKEKQDLSLVDQFWKDWSNSLTEVMKSAAQPSRGGIVRDILIQNYPRFVGFMETVFNRIKEDSRVKGSSPGITAKDEQLMLDATAPFQMQYLAQSLSRMTETVTSVFPGGNRALPSSAEVQKVAYTTAEELKSVSGSSRMSLMIATQAGKSFRLLAEKAEYMASSAGDVRTISAAVTPGQSRNIQLCCQLQDVYRGLVQQLTKLPEAAVSALEEPLQALELSAVEVVSPIFKAMMDRIEEEILLLHEAKYGVEQQQETLTDTNRHIIEHVALG
eukprot:TRINITY_DN4139_c0_g1_i2.p1 TRINITY_DN4139_c0_g1~~TRINITY_DN4139_c0_g1_i2.p1  ORF type:complete len:607 (-),score=92.38 TRINITY_DN4139_c0_g1_i2:38-1858(-)